jgi:transcriptional/translational regulatory protein YebC/TACO1
MFDRKCMFRMKTTNPYDLEELELELIDYGVEEIFEEENENEEMEIVLYGEFTAFNTIQKWIEENGYELVAAEFTRLPNVDLKVLEGDAKADIEKLIERIEEDDDVQNVYTTMQP